MKLSRNVPKRKNTDSARFVAKMCQIQSEIMNGNVIDSPQNENVTKRYLIKATFKLQHTGERIPILSARVTFRYALSECKSAQNQNVPISFEEINQILDICQCTCDINAPIRISLQFQLAHN